MRVLNSVRASGAVLKRREAVYLAVWVSIVAAIELTVRGLTNSDSQDALGIAVLASLIAVTVLDHIRQPLRSVSVILRLAKRFGRRFPIRPINVSIDLRGEPPIERGLPRTSEAALLVSLFGVICLGMIRSSLPVGLRESVIAFSPTLWFLLLGSTWAVALFSTAVLLKQPWAAFTRKFAAPSPRARQVSILLFILAVVWLVVVIPSWVPLLVSFICVSLVVLVGASPNNARLSLVFEEPGDASPPCALDWTHLIAIRGLISGLASGCLVLLMIGSSPLRAEFVTSMPITDLFGRLFLWAVCIGSCFSSAQILKELFTAREGNPGKADRPRLWMPGVPEKERGTRSKELAAVGFDLVFDEESSSYCDVRVAWSSDSKTKEADFVLDEKWLEDTAYLRRLAREHQTRCRRALRSGLQRVFEAAAAGGGGAGYWLAPHLWFFDALKRDSEVAHTSFTGPLFRDVFPIAARRHLRRVLDALEVDLIFFEDGVGFEHFDQTLDRLFELFDSEDAALRVEEFHLTGIPGLLVVLHEHGFASKLRSGTFPKPDYRFLGRARILHIFRDRNGESTPVEVPHLSGGVPDWMPVLV